MALGLHNFFSFYNGFLQVYWHDGPIEGRKEGSTAPKDQNKNKTAIFRHAVYKNKK